MAKKQSRPTPAPVYDQALILELGRCFMRAAVHAFIEEQKQAATAPEDAEPKVKRRARNAKKSGTKP